MTLTNIQPLTFDLFNQHFISESSISPESFAVDFNLVVKNIEELNLLSGADRIVIAHTKGGATLKVEF